MSDLDPAGLEAAAKALCPVPWKPNDAPLVRTYTAQATAAVRAYLAATPDPPTCRCPDDWRYDDGSVFCPQHQTKPDAPAASPDERLRQRLAGLDTVEVQESALDDPETFVRKADLDAALAEAPGSPDERLREAATDT